MDRVQPVEVMPVEMMLLQETTGLVGSLAANESAELQPEFPGMVESIAFQEGAMVKRGDLLVQLDTRELQAQLAEARAGFVLAEKILERNRSLVAEEAVSQLEVDTATAEHARLKAAIDRLEVQISKASIRAPFDGMAGARSISVGDYVSSQSVITSVDDLSRLKVEMQVPERYLPLLKLGARFSLKVATTAEGASDTGEVYFVSPRIDEASRSTLVKGFLTNHSPELRPGMFANITLILRQVEQALVVPEAAVLSTPRGSVLVQPVEKDGAWVASFIPVKLGLRVPGLVQVTSVGPPLRAGDRIVSSGVGGLILFPGAKVKPVEPMVESGPPAKTDRRLK